MDRSKVWISFFKNKAEEIWFQSLTSELETKSPQEAHPNYIVTHYGVE